MRWFLIDRFMEFEHAKQAVAIKTVSLGDESMDENLPGLCMYPPALIIEGMAQTGGLLTGEVSGFRERVVLAKITKATFAFPVFAGDTLTFNATLADIKPTGSICTGTVYCNQNEGEPRKLGDIDLVFAHLDDRFEQEQFEPAEFLRLLRTLRLYPVGRKADGTPLEVPPHMLAAERALMEAPV